MNDLNRFDRVANIYDPLKRFVFGRAIHDSEVCFLDSIQREANVLILGGGSGEMLRMLLQRNTGCTVWYVEASARMLELARGNAANQTSRVLFIHGTESSLRSGIQFDVIITNFFLDVFPEKRVKAISEIIGRHLANNGYWIITDFVNGRKWWQRVLLSAMYGFFKLACRIGTHKLPFWQRIVNDNGFREKESRMFYADFIKASLWVKDRT